MPLHWGLELHYMNLGVGGGHNSVHSNYPPISTSVFFRPETWDSIEWLIVNLIVSPKGLMVLVTFQF